MMRVESEKSKPDMVAVIVDLLLLLLLTNSDNVVNNVVDNCFYCCCCCYWQYICAGCRGAFCGGQSVVVAVVASTWWLLGCFQTFVIGSTYGDLVLSMGSCDGGRSLKIVLADVFVAHKLIQIAKDTQRKACCFTRFPPTFGSFPWRTCQADWPNLRPHQTLPPPLNPFYPRAESVPPHLLPTQVWELENPCRLVGQLLMLERQFRVRHPGPKNKASIAQKC